MLTSHPRINASNIKIFMEPMLQREIITRQQAALLFSNLTSLIPINISMLAVRATLMLLSLSLSRSLARSVPSLASDSSSTTYRRFRLYD